MFYISWQVGGNTFANIGTTTVKNSYLNEIKNPVENVIYNAKVGLIYVSDYGYAASSDACLINLSNYNDETILSNNWMYMGAFEWTISRGSLGVNGVFLVTSTGYVIVDYTEIMDEV